MVSADHLAFHASGRALVDDVSAEFAPGQLHLIIGPNGAGKSTLIKLLSRLIQAHAGGVRYDGADVAHLAERDLAKRRAVLSQAVEIAFPLTVREVVTMGRYPHFGGWPTAEDEAIIDETMALFDIADLQARSYPTLSGGEKQRVNFARVLAQVWRPVANHTRVLFLDEPLTFLDVRHQLSFMATIRTSARDAGMVVIGVIHDLNLAARFADRLLLLDRGRLVASGSPAEVLSRDHIRAVFGVDAIAGDVPGTALTQWTFV